MQHVTLIGFSIFRLQESHKLLPPGSPVRPPMDAIHDILSIDSGVKKIEILDSKYPKSDGIYWTKQNLSIIHTTPAGRIRATIEAENFYLQVFGLKATFAILILGILAVSFGVSKKLSMTLTQKINSIRDAITEVEKKQSFTQKISIDPKLTEDELEKLSVAFNNLLESAQQNNFKLIEAEREKSKVEIAAQVAHDIRAPLTTMSLAVNDLQKTTQAESLIQLKSAIGRISSVVQKISKAHISEENTEVAKLSLIDPLVHSWVSEHNQRYLTGKKIKLHILHKEAAIWGVLQQGEMQTAVSNLINNSFEAQASEVSLTLTSEKSHWVLQIRDNGAGISKEVINRIFDKNFSSGKSSGSGMGLFQAKNAVEWSGGNISVDSVPGLGTTFTIRLPKETEPAFIARQIEILPDQKIYFIDNDITVLEKWRNKCLALKNESFFFTKIEDFKNVGATENLVLVVDQRIGCKKESLDMIKNFKLSSNVYFCGNDFDEQNIQEQLQALRIRIIPRALIDSVSVVAKK